MISIARMGRDAAAYYRREYYLGEGFRGRWMGSGAAASGLSGQVEEPAFGRLFRGISPDGREAWTMNADSPRRRPGWDMVASAPKSYSVQRALCEGEPRLSLERAEDRAVEEVVAFFEEHAAFSRRGKDGRCWERSGLFIAAFRHESSRAMDPDSHVHLVVFNLSRREDGTVGALASRPLYQHRIEAGYVYRHALAEALEQNLGLVLERRDKGLFEIAGVPQAVREAFSERRRQIEAELDVRGVNDARAAAAAAVRTRPAKDVAPREALYARWRDRAQTLGFTQRDAARLIDGVDGGRERSHVADELITARAEYVARREEHRRELLAAHVREEGLERDPRRTSHERDAEDTRPYHKRDEQDREL